MITFNGKEYKLCLMDTLAASEIIKDKVSLDRNGNPINRQRKHNIGKNVIEKFLMERYYFCYYPNTICEIKNAPDIFDEFVESMCIMGTIITLGYEQLFEKEKASHPHELKSNDIIMFPVQMVKGPSYYQDVKSIVFNNKEFENNYKKFKEKREEILNDWLSFVPEYQPKGRRYTLKEIDFWVNTVTLKLIYFLDNNYYKNSLISNYNENVFKSLKSIAYSIFYNYYLDNRVPQVNDVDDIIMSCVLPYVDAVFTERFRASKIRMIQQRHNFYEGLEIFTLRDFRN